MRTPFLLACLLPGALLLAACDLAPPPPTDPDAKAEAKAEASPSALEREAAKHHELQQGIDAIDMRDKAAHANDPVIEADKKREQEIKDAGG